MHSQEFRVQGSGWGEEAHILGPAHVEESFFHFEHSKRLPESVRPLKPADLPWVQSPEALLRAVTGPLGVVPYLL